MPRQAIIIFLRAPEKGKVKTQLAKDVGDQAAVALYRMFVGKILTAIAIPPYPALDLFLSGPVPPAEGSRVILDCREDRVSTMWNIFLALRIFRSKAPQKNRDSQT